MCLCPITRIALHFCMFLFESRSEGCSDTATEFKAGPDEVNIANVQQPSCRHQSTACCATPSPPRMETAGSSLRNKLADASFSDE